MKGAFVLRGWARDASETVLEGRIREVCESRGLDLETDHAGFDKGGNALGDGEGSKAKAPDVSEGIFGERGLSTPSRT